MPYQPPIDEMRFALQHSAQLDKLATLAGLQQTTADLVDAALDEAAKLASAVIAPLNKAGDRQPPKLVNGKVTTAPGYVDAYRQFVAGGWNAVPFDPNYGGQGLPWALNFALQEMWQGASLSFGLCPLLTQGAIELLTAHGSAAQKDFYLPKLIEGSWTGTMCLTEPQAGSDLALLRAKAVPSGDHYRIQGQKIYITYGEHDLADNIIHMVLARLPDAAPGVKGISVFIVPKILPDGRRNDIQCVSLEHKLGIHASPTAVLSFGDQGGAVGYLIGEAGRGLEYMFTMMNNARLSVGLQGVAVADHAYQLAASYAKTRIQGKALGKRDEKSVPIIEHPDIRRMLLEMRALTEAGRAMAYFAASGLDLLHHADSAPQRDQAQKLVDLLTPLVKSFATDNAVRVADLGIQIHGGMGFIEETGAAQLWRDARILPIYEGTNGIQAQDFVFRKCLRDDGISLRALLSEMRQLDGVLATRPGDDLQVMRERLSEAVDALSTTLDWLLQNGKEDAVLAASAATSFTRLAALVLGGFLLTQQALIASALSHDPSADHLFLQRKIITARFYAEHLLPHSVALMGPIAWGHKTMMALPSDYF